MATLKEVKTKIGAVKKTKQITKAMNMVAASRLRGAQTNMEGFRPYAEKFAEVLGGLSGRAGEETSPLLLPHEEVVKKHIVLCTSDRGLCGGFNAHLISKADSFMKETGEDIEFSVTNFGKKGRDWSRKKQIPIINEQLGVIGTVVKFNIASTVGKSLIDGFLNGEYDEVYVVYSEFISMGRQVATIKQLLPIPPLESDEDEAEVEDKPYLAEHICEPSPDELLGELLPMSVYVQLFSAILETSTSEHAARMMAMDNASKACDDMIENLTMVYNKARQASITAELMDIVGGAEALRG
ncbi:MAG: ATP synthase F1 subunit gamma [Deltaproteobacteria bacterium]|nr:ATP synthase F1 subunit gamma [Deltaproteobacteria bacterium]MBW1958360.1 ATP synthase F1 subunit gamma [Deltaproteobacteria bacterium]MBW2013617.1 ATP synthase F1 subunit gamma [Deltaproteobacteria bacterium]MBW2089515.1 ATP synthase F1 subunit gamma [Deltaproteobacteria bacterium]MBW2320893.1 ATP synthase F1 subunit gamma [Deltaproteobacteria bacterium]